MILFHLRDAYNKKILVFFTTKRGGGGSHQKITIWDCLTNVWATTNYFVIFCVAVFFKICMYFLVVFLVAFSHICPCKDIWTFLL